MLTLHIDICAYTLHMRDHVFCTYRAIKLANLLCRILSFRYVLYLCSYDSGKQAHSAIISIPWYNIFLVIRLIACSKVISLRTNSVHAILRIGNVEPPAGLTYSSLILSRRLNTSGRVRLHVDNICYFHFII